jgi:lipid-binding SYLF domain-containing protein
MPLNSAFSASAKEINSDVKIALDKLYAKSSAAKALAEKAKGVLVFPSIVKGGFLVGGQYGEGALLMNGKTKGYYNTIQASYGLQAGLQKYGYVMFLMNDSALNYLNDSNGWEIGVGPSIVIVDVGKATSTTSSTLNSDIYAFFFDQRGLMGGIDFHGTKISEIEK